MVIRHGLPRAARPGELMLGMALDHGMAAHGGALSLVVDR